MPNAIRRRIRSQIAAASRHHPETDLTDLRRDLAAEKLAEYIDRTVSAAPPLTAAQRDHLAGLLRPSAVAGGASQ